MNVPKRERKKGRRKRNNKGKKMKEGKDDKHNLLYEHTEPVQTVGLQSWKIDSLNNYTGQLKRE